MHREERGAERREKRGNGMKGQVTTSWEEATGMA